MILTPIPDGALPALLVRLRADLPNAATRSALDRIVGSGSPRRAAGAAAARHRRRALKIAAAFGMEAAGPGLRVSWDGAAFRTDTEAYVLFHEVAHFQVAAPDRRRLVDFGLGPGPDTEDHAAAEACARLFGAERDREEAAASLLGILWEAEFGQPALASFLDQNWLEGVGRGAAAAEHFARVLADLRDYGCVTAEGRPTFGLRASPDPGGAEAQERPLRGAA